MEGWISLVGWPIADTLPTKWSHVNRRSGKVCRPKTDVLTTEPRHFLASPPYTSTTFFTAWRERLAQIRTGQRSGRDADRCCTARMVVGIVKHSPSTVSVCVRARLDVDAGQHEGPQPASVLPWRSLSRWSQAYDLNHAQPSTSGMPQNGCLQRGV